MIVKLGKWVAMFVTTGAAMVSVLNYLHNHGYLGGSEAELLALAASRVRVYPQDETVTAIGDTVQLAATVIDRRGTTIVGASATWNSDNPDVASVDSGGAVVSRAPGSATVMVSVGKQVARSRITVRPVVWAVRFGGDSTLPVPEGDRRSVSARGVDRRGSPVARPVSWRSVDTSVAAVDNLGNVTGVKPGRAMVVATVEGVSDSIAAVVVPVPGSLVIVAGADQRAISGKPLPQPVVVELLSRSRRPIPGHPLRFQSADGQGEAVGGTDSTDARGRVRIPWTLGAPGRQRLVVTADALDSGITVMAEAEPVAANTRVGVADSALAARAGSRLPAPVTVKVTDSIGRALADVPVSWTAMDAGAIAPIDARTDSLGEARAEWTLGPRAGRQRARIQVGNGRTVPAFGLTAVALPGPPAGLRLVSGVGQQGKVGAALSKPIIVRVIDSLGNAVGGASVTVVPVDGSVSDTVMLADSTGTVRIQWTLGREARAQTVAVRSKDVASPIQFTAMARPQAPANIAFVAPPSRGVVGEVLRGQVSVRVTDAYGNPVPDARVTFRVAAGRVAPSVAVTDKSGAAATRWTLGPGPGEQALSASVRGTEAKATLTLTATAVAAARSTKR